MFVFIVKFIDCVFIYFILWMIFMDVKVYFFIFMWGSINVVYENYFIVIVFCSNKKEMLI